MKEHKRDIYAAILGLEQGTRYKNFQLPTDEKDKEKVELKLHEQGRGSFHDLEVAVKREKRRAIYRDLDRDNKLQNLRDQLGVVEDTNRKVESPKIEKQNEPFFSRLRTRINIGTIRLALVVTTLISQIVPAVSATAAGSDKGNCGYKVAVTTDNDLGRSDIWIMNRDGSEQTNVTQTVEGKINLGASFNPKPLNGCSEFVYSSSKDIDDPAPTLWTYRNGSSRPLLDSRGKKITGYAPIWTDDGITFYSSKDNELYLVTAEGEVAKLKETRSQKDNDQFREISMVCQSHYPMEPLPQHNSLLTTIKR